LFFAKVVLMLRDEIFCKVELEEILGNGVLGFNELYLS
jgi:hypothetical protein